MIVKKNRVLLTIVLVMAMILLSACRDDEYFIKDREINVITREDGSGTRGAFIEILGIQRNVNGTLRDMTSREADVAGNTSTVIRGVTGNFYAIGYISLGSLGDGVRAVPIDGVQATPANVTNGSYPLFRGFHVAFRESLSPLAQDFIDFMLSVEGQEIVTNSGFVTVNQEPPVFTGGGHTGTIVVSGSTAVYAIMARLGEAYSAINPGVNVEVHSSGSSAGITGAINGINDIGMTSRDLTDDELTQVNYIPIAFDGLVVIVNNDNPLTTLSLDEVRQIFEGEKQHWSELIN